MACWGRQTGKSTAIALKALHFAFSRPRSTVLIVSPSERQSRLLLEKVKAFLRSEVVLSGRRIGLYRSVARADRTGITLTNGSKIIALPCSPERIRGFTADLVVIDEAAFVPEEVITAVVMPMLAATDGTLIMASTPWRKDHIFYRALTDRSGRWSVHHVPSTACPRISKSFLEEQKELMSEEEFRREYLAEFVEEGAYYFPTDLVMKCVKPELELARELNELASLGPGEYYAGLDLGKLRDYSALAVVEKSGRELTLRFLKVFELNTPYLGRGSVSEAVLRAHEELGLVRLAMDRSGVGEAVYEVLVEELGPSVLLGVKFTSERKSELLSGLKALMEAGRLELPYDRLLIRQLGCIRQEMTPSGKLKLAHEPGGHDDAVIALALACWAARKGPPGLAVRLWKKLSLWLSGAKRALRPKS